MSDTPWRLGHRPELNALRGVAILLVVLGHTWQTRLVISGAGVTVFFVLSGFLITSLLLEESTRTGRIDLAAFYRRRAVRLLPALFVFVAVMLFMGQVVGGVYPSPRQLLPVLFYVQNYAVQAPGYSAAATIGQTWSLSVEEQFYLVFPIVLLALLRWVPRRHLAAAVTALTGVAVGYRLYLVVVGAPAQEITHGTAGAACLLLVGSTLACWMARQPARDRSYPLLGVTAVVALIVIVVLAHGRWGAVLPLVTAGLTAVALVAFTVGPSTSWCAPAPLRLAGRVSYGLYLWHYPFIMTMYPDRTPLPLLYAWIALLTFLSWRYVEQPAQRWRRRPRLAVSAAGVRA